MYARLPTEQELAGTGFTLADYDETIEVWPENWPALELFGLVSTQWHQGFNGPVGLRYEIVFALMDRKGLAGDAWWQMLDDLRFMESTALDALRNK